MAKAKADADGSELPEEFEPPELLDGFGGWLEDFWELSTERQIGFGAGPIPGSAIEKHVAGWAYDDAEMFRFCIRELDGLYLMRQNKTEDAPPPAGSAMEAFRTATPNRQRG